MICSRKRFEELCVEKKNNRIEFGSIDETLNILEAERQEIVNKAVQPNRSNIDVWSL